MVPKVSVVVPIYNIEKYLRECLDSIINQTLKNIEIILVDDGSTDSSGSICDEYANKDSRIKVIHQKNQYVGIARNNGMAIATGEYLICLDSDDFFAPEMLEKMYNRGIALDADIVLCRSYSYNDKNHSISGYNHIPTKAMSIVSEKNGQTFSYKDIGDDIFLFFPLWPWDKLYKRSFLTKNNIKYPLDRAVAASEDMVFVSTSFALADKITYIPEFFITHRYHGKSLEATRNKVTGYVATLELEKELKKRNIFTIFEKSFINLAMNYLIFHLNYTKKKYYKEVYKLTRQDWFQHFHFEQYPKDYYTIPGNYATYKAIMKHKHPSVMKMSLKTKKTKAILKTCIW